MYAGVGNSPNAENCDMPEWKRLLIMKKRAATTSSAEESVATEPSRLRGPVSCAEGRTAAACEGLENKSTEIESQPAEKVVRTIGNIRIELRSVYKNQENGVEDERPALDRFLTSPLSEPAYPEFEEEDDLQYGPGIVDKLRSKFLNLGLNKTKRKPVVRKFSSLENLTGGNTRGRRPKGFAFTQRIPNFKKAQSMETLIVTDSSPFSVGRRTFTSNSRVFPTRQNKLPYNRQTSNINEDELPKPDTVKHVKRLFESPPAVDKSCPASINHSEKCSYNRATNIPSAKVPVSSGNRPFLAELILEDDSESDNSAKGLSPQLSRQKEEEEEEEITTNGGGETTISVPASEERLPSTETDSANDSPEIEEFPVVKVNPEQLPLLIESPTSSSSASSELDSPQGSDEAEQFQDVIERPHLGDSSISSLADMVIAYAGEDGSRTTVDLLKETLKKSPKWQKPPPSTTSIVFDFRGKDVKPQISLNPTPFGCRPAKVKKRSGSPPRDDNNGTFNGEHSSEEDDEEDWDELNIGADLPAISGIEFEGENIRVGKGSLLVTRNKKLSIQFDDGAISTFEYPCESPPPFEENGLDHELLESNLRPLKSSLAKNNVNNVLSNYTPQTLSPEGEFELGVLPPPPPIHRRQLPPSPPTEVEDTADTIVPAEDSSGWSSTESADILF